MTYVAHHAALDTVSADGSTVRDSYVVKADRARRKYGEGSAAHQEALALLDGPPPPYALRYLLEWFNELFGRSGKAKHGIAPMSFPAILAWRKLTGRKPAPHEVDALLALDGVRRNPERA